MTAVVRALQPSSNPNRDEASNCQAWSAVAQSSSKAYTKRGWRWGLAGTYAIALIASSAVRAVAVAPVLPADMKVVSLKAVNGEARSSQPVRLAYREDRGSGQGTPVLLLHGSPGASDTFAGLAPLLSAHRLVLAPDLPGFGWSSTGIPDYSFRAHALYVRDLLDAQGLRRVHVLGFSMGGGVALSLADIAPDRLESLSMVSAIGLQEMELLGEYHINHFVHGVQLAGLSILSRGVPHTGALDAPLSYARNFFDSDQRPLEGALRRIHVPTLFVHGRVDPLVPIEAAIEHTRLVPQSELHVIDDNHFMVFENPQRIATVVNGFLSRVDSGSAVTRDHADPSRVTASIARVDPRHVPRAHAVSAAVLGTMLAGASACCAAVGPVGAGVIAAQGRARFGWALACTVIGSLMVTVRRRSLVASVRSAAASVARTSIGIGAGALVLGTPVLAGAGAWTRAVAVTALICSTLWMLTIAFNYRRRRLLVASWLRLTHWEYWPIWVTYVPVGMYVIGLMLKHRSVTVFTAANPAMLAGGFVGESKIDILRGLGASHERVARSGFIDGMLAAGDKVVRANQFIRSCNLDLPVVLKPNAGQRGSGVVVARTWPELTSYLEQSRVDTVIQEYVPGLEFGVFYCRKPSDSRGRILSVTEKHLPDVLGDGRRTLEQLILDNRRTLAMARFHLTRRAGVLEGVPAAGTSVPLGDCGSHCRGATFLDGKMVLTPALEDAFEEVARAYDGFFFGRFDVRVKSREEFMEGLGFKIIELNGVTSEATHIYDPQVGIVDAYRALFEQWRLAFEIGAENRSLGASQTSLWRLMRLVISYREQSQKHLIDIRRSAL
jgi:pimeloyl-ACP methyl ester carboxylesterase